MLAKWHTLFVFTAVAFTMASAPVNCHKRRQDLGPVGDSVESDLAILNDLKKRQGSTGIAGSTLGNVVSPGTLSNVAALEALNTALQQGEKIADAELQQELGSGQTSSLDLQKKRQLDSLTSLLGADGLTNGILSLDKKKRQIYDTLASALDTNDLYDTLVDGGDYSNSDSGDLSDSSDEAFEKRDPLFIGGFAPSALGGTSKAAPIAQVGDILKKKKRSPLAIGGFAPALLGGESKSAPLVQVGNILKKKKRSPLSGNLPLVGTLTEILGGEDGESPLSEITDLLKKRSPLSGNLPLVGSLTEILGGEDGESPLSELTDLLKKRSPLGGNLPLVGSLTGLLGGDDGENPLSELTDLLKKKKRSPLGGNLPVVGSLTGLLGGEDDSSSGELGGLDILSELTDLLKRQDSGVVSQLTNEGSLLTDNLENTLYDAAVVE